MQTFNTTDHVKLQSEQQAHRSILASRLLRNNDLLLILRIYRSVLTPFKKIVLACCKVVFVKSNSPSIFGDQDYSVLFLPKFLRKVFHFFLIPI